MTDMINKMFVISVILAKINMVQIYWASIWKTLCIYGAPCRWKTF